MLIPVPFDKCILCPDKGVGDPEHIFPDCLGGTLQAHLLCDVCNNTFGSKLVIKLLDDPKIQLALQHVNAKVPFRVRTQQKLVTMAATTGEPIPLTYRKGKNEFCCSC